MIDVWGVVANGLWIAGLALLLAALSWAHWVASTERSHLRTVLARSGSQLALGAGLALFCAGLAATASAWWERALWIALAVVALVQVVLSWRRKADR